MNAFAKLPPHPFGSLWVALVAGCVISSIVVAVFGANMRFLVALFFSLLGGRRFNAGNNAGGLAVCAYRICRAGERSHYSRGGVCFCNERPPGTVSSRRHSARGYLRRCRVDVLLADRLHPGPLSIS
jgi:hypothetical protein